MNAPFTYRLEVNYGNGFGWEVAEVGITSRRAADRVLASEAEFYRQFRDHPRPEYRLSRRPRTPRWEQVTA